MDKLLEELKPRQLRPGALYCTAGSNCWCFKLETWLPSHAGYDICMTPKELLEMYSSELTSNDINYLKSIESREFIW